MISAPRSVVVSVIFFPMGLLYYSSDNGTDHTISGGLTAPWPIGLRRRRQIPQGAGTESYPLEWTSNGPGSNLEGGTTREGRSTDWEKGSNETTKMEAQVDVKKAVQLAKKYIVDVLYDENIRHVATEEVVFNTSEDTWKVTVSFFRPEDRFQDIESTLAGGGHGRTVHSRSLKLTRTVKSYP